MEDGEIAVEHQRMEEEQKDAEVNYQEQIEKIMNFQAITGTSNSDLAAKYLVKNDWDESRAAKEYIEEIDRQDFVNAQARAHNAMYNEQNFDIEPEAEALIDGTDYHYQERRAMRGNGRGVIGTILDYTIFPIGRGIKFLIPGFIKNMFYTPYNSALFLQGLIRNEIIKEEETKRPEGEKLNFETEYFTNAVREAHNKRKPLLFILTDFIQEETNEFMKEIFTNEEILKVLKEEYLIFGLETGNTEANSLTLEFDIREIPYFGVVMAKSENHYEILEHYKKDELDLEKFKEFITDSSANFKSILQLLVESHQYEAENYAAQDRGFVDSRHEADRQLMAQQRQEFEKAQEEDRIRLEKARLEEQEQRKKEQEKIMYESTIKELAKRKKSELPPEPEEGTTIKFREPVSGKSLVRKFNPADKVHILFDFIQSKFDEIQFESDSVVFEIGSVERSSTGAMKFKPLEDREKTLEEEGLCPTAMLQIREIDEEEESEEED